MMMKWIVWPWLSLIICRYNVNGFAKELPQLPETRYHHACAALPATGVRLYLSLQGPTFETCRRFWLREDPPKASPFLPCWPFSLEQQPGLPSPPSQNHWLVLKLQFWEAGWGWLVVWRKIPPKLLRWWLKSDESEFSAHWQYFQNSYNAMIGNLHWMHYHHFSIILVQTADVGQFFYALLNPKKQYISRKLKSSKNHNGVQYLTIHRCLNTTQSHGRSGWLLGIWKRQKDSMLFFLLGLSSCHA